MSVEQLQQKMSPKGANLIDRQVGSRIRLRRRILSLTQEQLGQALGITFQQVQKYEKGINRIGASRLEQISKVLDVPPSFFFQGPGISPTRQDLSKIDEGENVVDFLSTEEGLSITRAFLKISDAKVRKRLIDLVTELGESSQRRNTTEF